MTTHTTTTAAPLSAEQLDKLEALARAATPGPWFYQEDSDAYTHIVRSAARPGAIIGHFGQDTSGVAEAIARFIANANPATILALIAQARAAATYQPQAAMYQADGAMCQPGPQATATQPVGEQALPPLPVAAIGNNPYTADQMRAYARAALDHRVSSAPTDTVPTASAGGLPDNYTVDDSELARRVMVFLGRATTASMEPGADPLRDRLAEKLAEWRATSTDTPSSAAPAAQAVGTDLLPPMGIRNDRDMLNYLMVAFDNEMANCELCGHAEPTKNMDSAGFLRSYLAAAPAAAAALAEDAKDAARLVKKLNHIAMSLAAEVARGKAYTFQGQDYLGRNFVCERVIQWRREWDATYPAQVAIMDRARAALSSTQHSAKAGGDK